MANDTMPSRPIESYSDAEFADVYNDLVAWLLEITEMHCKLLNVAPAVAGVALLSASVRLSRKDATNTEIRECVMESLDLILQSRPEPEKDGSADEVTFDMTVELEALLQSARGGNPLAIDVLDTIRRQATEGNEKALFIIRELDQLVQKG